MVQETTEQKSTIEIDSEYLNRLVSSIIYNRGLLRSMTNLFIMSLGADFTDDKIESMDFQAFKNMIYRIFNEIDCLRALFYANKEIENIVSLTENGEELILKLE